jgi:hypothetical protein
MFNVFQSGTGPAATTGLIPGLNFVIYDDSVARITLDNVTNYQGAVALSSRSPATSSTIGTVFKTDRTIDGASKISSFRNYATEQLAINHRGDIVSNRGTGSTEVAVKLGSTIDAAGISDGAKLLSISTGITGSNEKEHIYFTKGSGSSFGAGMVMEITPSLHGYISVLPLLGGLGFGVKEGGTYLLFNYNNGAAETFYGFTARNAGGTYFARIGTDAAATYPNTTASYGRFDQYGTDSSATPGNATINRPTGISAIPVGSSSVTITNSIAYANSRINLTWLGDTGAARTWVTRATGSFTVNISAPSTANAAFSWEVASLLP